MTQEADFVASRIMDLLLDDLVIKAEGGINDKSSEFQDEKRQQQHHQYQPVQLDQGDGRKRLSSENDTRNMKKQKSYFDAQSVQAIY